VPLSELRFGLAGLGVHGTRYAEHLLSGDVPGARLTAISRRDDGAGQAFARERGLAFVADPIDLATRDGVDAVIAVLPPTLHAGVASACLSSGRPVLVEKPMAATAGDAERIAALASSARAPLMVAHTLRFDPVVEAILRETSSLGAIRMVAIHQRFEPSLHAWLDEPGPGGILLNTGVHGFDLLRHLTGAEPVSVLCEAGSAVTRSTEDQIVATFRMEPGGILCVVDNSRATAGRSGRIEVVGERGQIAGDHVHRTLHRVTGRVATDLGSPAPVPTVVATLRAFVRSIREGTEPPITARDGLAAVRMAEAAALSARTGRRVTI
jgi:myo-inositol 2-dehydrogenase/D-chiro-inositol 1-dehydrogenase